MAGEFAVLLLGGELCGGGAGITERHHEREGHHRFTLLGGAVPRSCWASGGRCRGCGRGRGLLVLLWFGGLWISRLWVSGLGISRLGLVLRVAYVADVAQVAVWTTSTRAIASGCTLASRTVRLGFVLLLVLLVVRLLVFLSVFTLLLINLQEPGVLDIIAKRNGVAAHGVLIDPCFVQLTVFRLTEAALAGEVQPVAGAIEGGIAVIELTAGDFVALALHYVVQPNAGGATLGQ